MDKIWWNEAWMGTMGPHYAANSNVTHAAKLRGKSLLTVGEPPCLVRRRQDFFVRALMGVEPRRRSRG